MQIQIFYSYACRDTYKVVAWLDCVQQQGTVLDLIWHPFAVEMENEADWSQPWETARSELRGFIAAEAARQQGEEVFLQFHSVLEKSVHERLLELGDETTLLDAARQAGLDLHQFQTALYKPAMAQLVGQSHLCGVEQFKVFGTPTLIFPPNQALYVELEDVPNAKDALPLFEGIAALGIQQPSLRQLKRTLP